MGDIYWLATLLIINEFENCLSPLFVLYFYIFNQATPIDEDQEFI